MGRMLRNLIPLGVKEGAAENENLKKYVSHSNKQEPAPIATDATPPFLPQRQLVQTILDQCHLSPLTLSVRPTLWDFDHALRLYPMPSAVSVVGGCLSSPVHLSTDSHPHLALASARPRG